MRWLEGITNPMEVNLGKLRQIVWKGNGNPLCILA